MLNESVTAAIQAAIKEVVLDKGHPGNAALARIAVVGGRICIARGWREP